MTNLFEETPASAPREDEFRARIGRARASGGGTSGALGARLTKAMKGARVRVSLMERVNGSRGFSGDQRQRVVAKVSYHKHGLRRRRG